MGAGATLAVLLLAAGAVGQADWARAPNRGEARGVLVLRPAPQRRARILGGPANAFVMGSTSDDLVRALQLCKREVFAPLCEDEHLKQDWLLPETLPHAVEVDTFDLDRPEV